jgi:hypothetical protein
MLPGEGVIGFTAYKGSSSQFLRYIELVVAVEDMYYPASDV